MMVAMDTVLRVVADQFGVTVAEIKSARRSRHVLPARHVTAYLAHTVSEMTPREIGEKLGGRDYTIIVMYCRTIERRVAEDGPFNRILQSLEERIRNQADLRETKR